MEQAYRSGIFLRFGGGANEVQRNIIAQRGLGMPREAAQPRQDLRSPQAAAGRA